MIEVYEKEDNCGRLCVAEVNDVTLKVVIEVKVGEIQNVEDKSTFEKTDEKDVLSKLFMKNKKD